MFDYCLTLGGGGVQGLGEIGGLGMGYIGLGSPAQF